MTSAPPGEDPLAHEGRDHGESIRTMSRVSTPFSASPFFAVGGGHDR